MRPVPLRQLVLQDQARTLTARASGRRRSRRTPCRHRQPQVLYRRTCNCPPRAVWESACKLETCVPRHGRAQTPRALTPSLYSKAYRHPPT